MYATAQLTATEARTVRAILDSVLEGWQMIVFESRATGRAGPLSDLNLNAVRRRCASYEKRVESLLNRTKNHCSFGAGGARSKRV